MSQGSEGSPSAGMMALHGLRPTLILNKINLIRTLRPLYFAEKIPLLLLMQLYPFATYLFFGTDSASYYRLCGRNIGALRSWCQNAKASGLCSPEACGRAAIWFFACPHICVRHAGSETGSGG